MPKLFSWLTVIGAFLSVWLALLYQFSNYEDLNKYQTRLLYLPLLIIIMFGIYSATVVLWRVFNFNDCQKEAIELQQEIKEAKADLTAKGFIFK